MKRITAVAHEPYVILTMMGCYASLMGFRNAAISITLAQRQLSAGAIGMNGLGQCIAMLLVALVLPRAITRVGCRNACALALSVEATALALLALSDNLLVWFVCRTLLGLSTAALCAAGETLLGASTPDDSRGRIMGIYTAILGVGLSAGPALLSASVFGGLSPFATVWVLVGLTAILVACLRPSSENQHLEHPAHTSIRNFLTKAPLIAVLFVLIGMKDTAQSTFLPILGMQLGLSSASSSLLLSACLLGGVTIPALVGTYSDRTDKRLLLSVVCLVYGGLSFVLVGVLHQPVLRFMVAFAFGGFGSSIFALGMTLVGNRFSGHELTSAYVATGSLWGVGSLLGNIVVGGAIGEQGGMGFSTSTGGPFLLVGLLFLWVLARVSRVEMFRGARSDDAR
ncbi:MFS transporter [Paraburkholderia sp. IW21]|uniref:MFS transporter n=1 Tax=Paraburkholderia sp. IW21 TaxID=3242488 RepID=UPI0035208913